MGKRRARSATGPAAAYIWPPNLAVPGTWDDTGKSFTVAGIPPNTDSMHGVVEVDPIRAEIQVSQVAIAWNAAFDVRYQVQYFSTNTWKNLGPQVIGSGASAVIYDTTEGQRKLYRILVLP